MNCLLFLLEIKRQYCLSLGQSLHEIATELSSANELKFWDARSKFYWPRSMLELSPHDFLVLSRNAEDVCESLVLIVTEVGQC